MNKYPKTMEQKFNTAAKFVSASSLISFIVSGVLIFGVTSLETSWEWLAGWRWAFEAISAALLMYAFLAMIISLLIPAPLILIFPALGYAWLRGGIRHFFSFKPWREVPDGEAFLSLLGAMYSFILGLLILYELVINQVFGEKLASFVATKLMAVELWLHQP